MSLTFLLDTVSTVPKHKLNLHIKTEPVTDRARIKPVFVWFLCPTNAVASAPSIIYWLGFYADPNQTFFGTVWLIEIL